MTTKHTKPILKVKHKGGKFQNMLYTGDNLYIMNGMNSESVDLIYTDPPFNSKRTYSAPIGSKAAGASFKDMWTWQDVDVAYLEKVYNEYSNLSNFIDVVMSIHGTAMASYLCFMMQRIIEMHRILKPTGSFYLHIDPTASHYLKIILDRIFGKNNFMNEIIWHYKSGGISKKKFAKKHDIILFYSKSSKNFFDWEAVGVERGTEKRNNMKKEVDEDGRIYYTIKSAGKIYKYYDNQKMATPDVWTDISHLQQKDPERTGYPTQKPLKLLHRIIKASSNEGDVVLDPFCGCATALVASQQTDRNWIGIDIEEKAGELISNRLKDDLGGMFTDFVQTDAIPQRNDIKIEKRADVDIRQDLHKKQNGMCNGCGEELAIKHFHLDHVIPKSKGGQNTFENYQLLCMSCNTSKSNDSMEKFMVRMNKKHQARLAYQYNKST